MKREHYTSMLTSATADRGVWRSVAVLMAVANLVLGAALLVKQERTVIVPPSIEKGFWISGKDASPEYLQDMALWFARLALDVDASSVEYQTQVLLRYIAPQEHGAIKTHSAMYAERIRRDEIAQVFFPSHYKIDAPNLRVALTGTLQRWVGKTPVDPVRVTYRIQFQMNAGRIVVNEFKEADPDEPFNKKADRSADDDSAVMW